MTSGLSLRDPDYDLDRTLNWSPIPWAESPFAERWSPVPASDPSRSFRVRWRAVDP